MLRRFTILAALTIAVAGLTACGDKAVTHGETEGVYITTGNVKYQVEISRVLNPADVEDREYLYGLSPADAKLKPDENWFAVFVRAENESKTQSRRTASSFQINDTTGAKFEPVPQSVRANPHAWAPTVLGPESTFPAPNSTAGGSTTAGSVLLFKIPVNNFANRPLELHIQSPTGKGDASVSLDV